MKTTEIVEQIAKPVVEGLGFELCDVEFIKEYGNWTLTLYIDKEGGVDLNDCEQVSRAVDPVLDEHDPIAQPYYLSVSSLGIDRPLKKDRDFERNLLKEVTAKLYAPLNGKKEYTGVLESYTEESFVLNTDKGPVEIRRKDCAQARPYIRF